jgi:polysaccharide biosynthesis transport protein
MKLIDIFRIAKKNFHLLIGFPLVLAGMVYYLVGQTPKTYTSDFLVYTGIASGFKLTGEENPRVDFFLVNNGFDNLLTTLKARETLEEVGLRLLAAHLLLKEPSPGALSKQNFQRLQALFPAELRKKLLDSLSADKTYSNLLQYRDTSHSAGSLDSITFKNTYNSIISYRYSTGSNEITKILNTPTEVYSIGYIRENLKAKRRENSDMLEVVYTSNDPAVTQMTLILLSEVFLGKYKVLKESEIDRVIKYFTAQSERNKQRLKDAEQALKDFGMKHQIINYDEQTKNITTARQDLHARIEQEKMAKAAAESALKKINEKLAGRNNLMENNQMIMEKRKELAAVNHKIANADLKKTDGKQLIYLQEQADALKNEIKNLVKELYKINNTQEGIQSQQLLDEYLSSMLKADEAGAKLTVMQQINGEYDSMYTHYAPLGSALAALEREVKVAENEYMQAATALNTNLQKKQNLSMSGSLKLVDSPYYPGLPDPGNRMILTLGSFVAGFVLIFGALLGIRLINDDLRTPSRAERITGLELIGVFPLADKKKKSAGLPQLEAALADQCASSLILHGKKESRPVKIVIAGTRDGEGKIRVAAKIACKLAAINGKVLLLYPNVNKIEMEAFLKDCADGIEKLVTKEYSVSTGFSEITTIADLLPQEKVEQYNYIVTVIPSLTGNLIPVKLLEEINIPLLVVSATRKWRHSDRYILKIFKKACSKEPKILLNKVKEEDIEEVCGKIEVSKADKKTGKVTEVKRRFLKAS